MIVIVYCVFVVDLLMPKCFGCCFGCLLVLGGITLHPPISITEDLCTAIAKASPTSAYLSSLCRRQILLVSSRAFKVPSRCLQGVFKVSSSVCRCLQVSSDTSPKNSTHALQYIANYRQIIAHRVCSSSGSTLHFADGEGLDSTLLSIKSPGLVSTYTVC